MAKPELKFIQASSMGWSHILASPKSLLETGESLDETRLAEWEAIVKKFKGSRLGLAGFLTRLNWGAIGLARTVEERLRDAICFGSGGR